MRGVNSTTLLSMPPVPVFELISVFSDVEHPQDPSEMETSANSGKIPDANARSCSPGGCAEYQQAGTHSRRGSNRKVRHQRRTTSERYKVNSEHRRKRAEGKYT